METGVDNEGQEGKQQVKWTHREGTSLVCPATSHQLCRDSEEVIVLEILGANKILNILSTDEIDQSNRDRVTNVKEDLLFDNTI